MPGGEGRRSDHWDTWVAGNVNGYCVWKDTHMNFTLNAWFLLIFVFFKGLFKQGPGVWCFLRMSNLPKPSTPSAGVPLLWWALVKRHEIEKKGVNLIQFVCEV